MPKKIKKATKTKHVESDLSFEDTTSDVLESSNTKTQQGKPKTLYIVVGLALILLGVLAVKNGYVLAAIVNGRPVFRWDLNNTLMSRYGKQTLESVISEQLIVSEAEKAKIVVTQKDIDQKESEILKSFGGKVTIDDVLKFQGMTKADFDKQVKIQLMAYKLLGNDATATDEEVSSFIESNKTMLTATEEGAMRQEAKSILLEQKVNEKIQPWFTEVKNKAKILRFL